MIAYVYTHNTFLLYQYQSAEHTIV